MAKMNHTVDQQKGGGIHRESPAKRKSEDYDVRKISPVTKEAVKRICGKSSEPATPEDYQHMFESILGRAVVADILK
ncbi:hypothetical protein [Maridesulfovibrio sp.]|uniref:hypothetical protein n=1 Tax=Maridesulfovibrio sp. TaxID=2795000 RepID=UPI003BAC92CC